MAQSTRLALPYLVPGQAQKDITHNESIKTLDILVQTVIQNTVLTEPPVGPAEGDCYIVATPATGDWTGQENAVAAFQNGTWIFYPPTAGWHAYDSEAGVMLRYTATGWQAAQTGGAGLDFFGIHTDADTTNRLAVAAEASLLTHDGAGHQCKINKAADTDTASLLFQSGWSGRAEMGLCGDDNWHLKVSADGTGWVEALMIDKDNGFVSIGGLDPVVPFQCRGRAIFSNHPDTVVDEANYVVQIQNTSNNTSMKFAAGATSTAYFGIGSTSSGLTQNISVYNGDQKLRMVNNGSKFTLDTSGAVRPENIGTTASAANAFLDSADGNSLKRSTSSLAYKRDVEALDPAYSEALLALKPIWYRSVCAGDNPGWSWYGFAAEQVAEIDPRMVHWGYGPDDFEAVEIDVAFDKLDTRGQSVPGDDGKPEQVFEKQIEHRLKEGATHSPQGVAYERFVVHHQVLIGALEAKFDALKARVDELEGVGNGAARA